MRVCYMGIAGAEFSRTKVYIQGLRAQGVGVVECFDDSRGLRKFVRLWRKHSAVRNSYDVLIIGNPSYILVPFARLLTRRPILFDAGWPLYEGVVSSRGAYGSNPLGRAYIWCIDRLAAACADLITLETEAQIRAYTKLLRISDTKCRVLYTGCDETTFFAEPPVDKRATFTAVFRGKANPEAGVETVIDAGRLLEKDGIDLIVYSPKFSPNVTVMSNVRVVADFLPQEELRQRMLECHVSLGQISTHERLENTIPHKAFESLAMGLPYISVRTRATEELLEHKKNAYFIEDANAETLAEAVRTLRKDPVLLQGIREGALRTYREKAAQSVLATRLLGYLRELAA